MVADDDLLSVPNDLPSSDVLGWVKLAAATAAGRPALLAVDHASWASMR